MQSKESKGSMLTITNTLHVRVGCYTLCKQLVELAEALQLEPCDVKGWVD